MVSEIKAGSLLNYVNIFLRIGIGLFLSPFILSHLGESEYGLYTIAGTIVGYIALMDFGLTASTGRFLSEYQAKKDIKGEAHFLGNITAIFSLIAIGIMSCGIVIFFFLDKIFPNFTPSEMSIYKVLYLLALANTACCFPLNAMGGILTSRTKFFIPGLARTALSLLNVTGTFLCLTMGYKSIALLSVNVITGVSGLIFNAIYAFGYLKVRMTWNGWDWALCRKVYAFSSWVFVSYLSGVLNWGSGSFILGMTCTPTDIAIFSFGMALFSYYFTFSSAIPGLFTARIVQMVTNNASKKEITLLMSQVSRVLTCILFLLFTGIILFGQEFLELWVGDTLQEQTIESWYVAVILCSGATLPLIQSIGNQVLQAMNLVKENARIQILIAATCVVLGYLASQEYGVIAVASATACSYVIGQVFYLNWVYKKKAGIILSLYFTEVFSKLPLVILFPLSAYFLTNHFIQDSSWEVFFCKISIYIIVYIPAFCFLYLRREERVSYCPILFRK